MQELLRYRLEEAPDRRLYVFLEQGEIEAASWTRADLVRKASAVAASLQRQGLRKGDCALLVYPQGLDFVAALVGCMLAGVRGVPAPTPDLQRLGRTAPRLGRIARNAGASAVLVHSVLEELSQHLPAELPDAGWIVTDRLSDALGAGFVPVPSEPDDVAYLQYTSGSTSDPKGVRVTQRNLVAHGRQLHAWFPLRPTDTVVSWLPEFHDFGLIYGVLQALWSGCESVLMAPSAFVQRPLRWLEAVTRYRGTISPTPNFGLELCAVKSTPAERARLDLSTWSVMSGSEPIHADTEQRFLQAFAGCGLAPDQLLHAYGMAEATLVLSAEPPGRSGRFVAIDPDAYERNEVRLVPPATPGAQTVAGNGPPLEGVELRIVDPETREALAEGRVGEVWARGANICAGYHEDRPTTDALFRARIEPTGEGDWLRTGDLGFLSGGELYLSGRLKDLIIVHGANKHPQDLEWAIQAMHPAFRQNCSAAFGHYVEGEERLGFVAEVRPELLTDPEAVFAPVREIAALQGLLVWRIALIEPKTLPKTSSGKVQRRLTRDLLLGGKLRILAEWTMTASPAEQPELCDLLTRIQERPKRARALIVDRLRARTASILGTEVDLVSADRPLRDQGLDSVGTVDLVEWLEKATGTELGVETLFEQPTLHAISDLVVRRLGLESRGGGVVARAR